MGRRDVVKESIQLYPLVFCGMEAVCSWISRGRYGRLPASIEKITEKTLKVEVSERRAGDPAILIASSEKALKELNWKIEFDTIEKIIETAWNWHKNHPNGYGDK